MISILWWNFELKEWRTYTSHDQTHNSRSFFVFIVHFSNHSHSRNSYRVEKKSLVWFMNLPSGVTLYTANILTVLSTAFGSVTWATVIWLHISQSKIAIDIKLYSSVSLNVMSTVVACNNHCQITLAHVTQTMTVNWL